MSFPVTTAWEVPDTPSVCVCGDMFSVDHAMICKRGGLVFPSHNELRDLEAELFSMVCKDVEVEPVLQDEKSRIGSIGSQHRPRCAAGYSS